MKQFAKNIETGEVYEAVPDWRFSKRMEEWKAAMEDCGHDVAKCSIPSPLPYNHFMFCGKNAYGPAMKPLAQLLADECTPKVRRRKTEKLGMNTQSGATKDTSIKPKKTVEAIKYKRGRRDTIIIGKRMTWESKCGKFRIQKIDNEYTHLTRYYALILTKEGWRNLEHMKTYRTRKAAERALDTHLKSQLAPSVKGKVTQSKDAVKTRRTRKRKETS